MQDEINRFWIPIAQILPVFILGLVVKARVALSPSKKGRTQKTAEITQVRFTNLYETLDAISRIVYALVFVIAMASLVVAFILSIAILAGGKAQSSSVSMVLIIAIIGAALTGLLPVSRLLGDLVLDLLADLVDKFRKRRTKTGRHPKVTARRQVRRDSD
jgi:hypothetical protein